MNNIQIESNVGQSQDRAEIIIKIKIFNHLK